MMRLGKINKILQNPQFLIDSLADGVFVVDPKGIIIAANKAGVQMLGYKKNDVIGKPCLKPFGALDDKGHPITKNNAALYDAILNDEETVNATRQFSRTNGEKFWASISVTPYNDTKKRHGAVIVFRDISEEKQMQEYQTEFARVASHQLRSPISNLRWAAEGLLDPSFGKLTATQKETIHMITGIIKDLNRLVNDLLHVSKLEDKSLKRGRACTSVTGVINTVFSDLSHYATASNVLLDQKFAEGSEKICADMSETHLRTIIQNLVENGIRYAYPGTTVHVRVKKRGKQLQLDVTNTGIGIKKKDHQYIFSKFYRSRDAIQKQGDGTGLGLYVTQKLVKMYGGSINFTSTPGKDTTFTVLLKTYGKKK